MNEEGLVEKLLLFDPLYFAKPESYYQQYNYVCTIYYAQNDARSILNHFNSVTV